MNRREFLQSLALTALAATPLRLHAAPDPYTGRFLLVLQMEGGWDVTNFCDPKMNIPGEPEITHWSRTQDIESAGNLLHAPLPGNSAFYNKYRDYMMVINGVDSQTNSHSVGQLHNWSGRNALGYPTLTAMHAAHNALGIPLSYINFGGFADGAKLIRYNRLDSVDPLLQLIDPNTLVWEPSRNRRRLSEYTRVQQFQQARMQRLAADGELLPRQAYNITSQAEAQESKQLLQLLGAVLPAADQFEADEQVSEQVTSNLRRQIQMAILSYKAGVAAAADLLSHGHDTHSRHDLLHEPLIAHMTAAVDYLWEYAESQGVADRITLVIGSDFSRTPYYNADNGKDHWPVGSYIVMEKNAPWGNRMVGLTDGAQNAFKINPGTLLRDDAGGTIIYPKHVHKALRRYLGLEGTAVDANFLFSGVEDFDFFNPALSTPQS